MQDRTSPEERVRVSGKKRNKKHFTHTPTIVYWAKTNVRLIGGVGAPENQVSDP